MQIELTKEILGLASAISILQSVNQPKAKKLKELFANKILQLIK